MRVLLQRTSSVEVWIDGGKYSSTGSGLLLLMGTKKGDKIDSCGYLADKILNMRLFEDSDGKMNLSALDVGADIMIVSQFTLYADTRKGRRPSFNDTMEPEEAKELYKRFIELIQASGLKTATGVFGAHMDVRLNNNGPVTILVEHELP